MAGIAHNEGFEAMIIGGVRDHDTPSSFCRPDLAAGKSPSIPQG